MNPIISIIIPCYNHGKYIEETLASIEKAKDRYPIEIIIVNDGSTDEYTISVLKKIEEKGYFVLNQNNGGLGNARNNGIKLAKGKYILPLDSDNNVLYPYLNDAVDILEKNINIDIVYGDAVYFGEQKGIWKNKEIDVNQMLFLNHIDACAVFRKRTWETNKGYAENMPKMGNEDWNFWIKCIINAQMFFYLDKNCFEYRVMSNSMIRSIEENHLKDNLMYCFNNNFDYYYQSILQKNYILDNVFKGNIFKKIIKLALNHFNLYKY